MTARLIFLEPQYQTSGDSVGRQFDGVLPAKNKTRFTRLRETACGLL
jgi:hypothetical protein